MEISKEDVERFFQATSEGNLRFISECIDRKNIPVDITDKYGVTPLMMASRRGEKEVAKALIKTYKCDINAQDKRGFTALHWAIDIMYHSVIDLLLHSGTNLAIKSEKGQTARELAESQDKRYTAKMIKDFEKEQELIRQRYLSAVKYGSVFVQLVTVLLVGPPGVGKSSLSHYLVGKMLPLRRRSSGSVSFSPKVQAKCSLDNTFTWTELSLNDELDRAAGMIAPIVAANLDGDHTVNPERRRNLEIFMKYFGKKVKKNLPHKLKKALSCRESTTKAFPPLTKAASSIDVSVISKVASNDWESSDKDEMKSFITIMDSGGQKAFLNLYPVFVQNPSMVMIVFKMTEDPDCIWKPLPKDEYYTMEGMFTNLHQINYSTVDLIRHTMASISTYADISNSSTATRICCVGTHKDQVSSATIASIDQQLTDLVQESGYAPLVLNRKGKSTKTLFPVNNLAAGHPDLQDEAVQELREVPLKFLASGKMDNSLHEIPIRWMNLELHIREQCQLNEVKYIPYTEACDIALHKYQFEGEEEFLNMLQYFHNLSLLLHYKDIPHLKDIIIIDNNLILENLSKLVEFTFTGKGITSFDFKNFKYCGVFSEDLLNHPELESEINPQGLVQLLISLNVVSPLPAEQLYFMPCVLPNIEEFTESCDDFFHTKYGPRQFSTIAIQFTCGSIPRGVFCSLIVSLMNSSIDWALCRSSSPYHKEVFSNLATFTLPSGHRVSIHDKMSHCEIQIRHDDCTDASIIHKDVLSTILDSLTEVCTTMSLHADFHAGFQCFNKKCSHSNNHFVLSKVSLSIGRQDSGANSICRLSGNPNKLTKDQEVWVQPKKIDNSPNINKEIKEILSGHSCDGSTKVDMSELLTYFTDNWSAEWESIGIKLGLAPMKLQGIRMDHHSVNRCCCEMLIVWSRSAVNACYCKLVTALYELNIKEAAMKIARDKFN